MNANELLSQLRKFVLIKSGLRNIDPGHCKTISEYIFQDTKNYVSETTIKRFFGFANTLHKFSLFTLNSLSQYIGYPDWDAFCSDKENQNYSVENVWEDLKLKCQAITDVSLVAKKNNSGVPFHFTAKRTLIYPDFDYFLKNNYQFTTITAQPGHGKSILLAHLVEHFFYAENAIYKKDIVLLINSTIIRTIIQNNLSLKDWFYQEFKLHSLNELITYFNKHKDKREGRFILIIDGLDGYLAKSSYFKIFIDFLLSVEENNFVKIAIGMRTTSWVNLQPAILGSAFLTRSWYKGLFVNTQDQSNIPLLNPEEILSTLSKIEGENLTSEQISPALFRQFKIPFWIQIYYALKQENELLDLRNEVVYYELVNSFLEKKVFLAKQSTEKIFILKKIASLTTGGNKGPRVAKEQILDYIIAYPEAYQDLLWSGILIQEKRLSTAIPTEIVRFLSEDLYVYFIFIQLTDKHQYKLCKGFFEDILTSISANPELRTPILNWSIRFCIGRNQTKALKYIFKLPFSNAEKNKAFFFICDMARYELGKSASTFNKLSIDQHFVDIMVTGRIMSESFANTIKYISNTVLNEDVQIMLHVIECTIYISNLDKLSLANTMQILKQDYKRMNELFAINPYDLILYFYNSLSSKPTESRSLEEKIVKLCQEINKSTPLKNDEITSVEILTYRLVLTTLFAQRNYAECHRFIMAILNKYPNIFFIRHSVFSSYLLIILGQTYLKLHYYKKAQRIIQFLDKIISSDYTYYTDYIIASNSLLKANFYNYTGKYPLASAEIESGLSKARTSHFRNLEASLLLMKIDLLKNMNATEQIPAVIKELLSFLSSQKVILADYTNFNNLEFDHTFKILKSYKLY